MTNDSAPVLPSGMVWIASAASATDVIRAGSVPVVLPSDDQRARRWATVLNYYGGVQAFGVEPVSQRQVIVSVGGAIAVGQAAAVALGRVHHHVSDLASAATVAVPAGASVLLVAEAARCSFAALHPVLQTWERDGIRSGVLTGLDEAGMVFALAKMLADRHGPRSSGETDIRFDGSTGIAETVGGDRPSLTDALGRPWRCVVVDAHGTGSHATLGPAILCGLSGDRERLSDRTPILDGCASGRCRAGRDVLEQILIRDMRCRTLALFVCNGITLVPSEQFPSDVALSLAALEGFPATILGLLRQDTDTGATEATTAATLISAGVANGTVVSWLAQDATSRGRPSSYLLLGDPDHAQPAITQAPELVPWPQNRPLMLPAVLDSAGRPVSAVLTRDGVLCPPGIHPITLHDAAAEVAAAVEELALWITDCDEAAHLEAALLGLMSATSKRRTVLTECLERMEAHRLEARRIALSAIRAAQDHRRTRRGAPAEVQFTLLQEQAVGWAMALNDAVLARAGTFRLWEALEANHLAYPSETHSACWRCGAPLTHMDLTSPLPGLGDRVSVTCPRCGPNASYPTLWPMATHGPDALDLGGKAEVTVTIPDGPYSMADDGVLSVQLQDRAGLRALTHESRVVSPGANYAFDLPVPSDLSPDLHRIWTLWSHRFRVSLLQIRIPTSPAVESAPAGLGDAQ